ncbi:efflux RND transporter periplasmic adaptor subunit [Inquilinus limosus]|uniref:efflux RND transporter periplasmic adaptor subunit n=1 Tax=Inquilinus limosus TaxID=171674 RepID=UPI003F16913D
MWKQLVVIGLLTAAAAGVWHYAPWQADGAVAPRSGPAAVPVALAPVRTGTVTEAIDAVGTTRAREAVTITAKTSGIVDRIEFEDGQVVAAGAPIIRLDSAELEATVASAEAELRNARLALERGEALSRSRNMPQAQLDTLRADVEVKTAAVAAQKARLAERVIVAPFAGTLGIRQVSPGALVSPGTAIVTLDDLSRVKVDFNLPEVLLPRLAPGVALEVHSDAYPDRAFTATITSVDTRIDPATRSVTTVAEIDNRDGLLRPGMFMVVRVQLSTDPKALLVPEQALVPQGARQFVYLVVDGRAVRREVTLGTRLRGEVQILSGLAAGEAVVVEGTQRLRDGVPVEVQAAGAALTGT